MHPSVHAWVTQKAADYGLTGRSCLDVGCFATDYLKIRQIFTDYWGVDVRPGPNVDQVVTGGILPNGPWEIVVSTEMLEHDERPWRTVAEMARVLAPGGYMLLTARGYDERGCYPVHEHPQDFWRFSLGSMRTLVEDCGLVVLEAIPDPEFPGVFLLARK